MEILIFTSSYTEIESRIDETVWRCDELQLGHEHGAGPR